MKNLKTIIGIIFWVITVITFVFVGSVIWNGMSLGNIFKYGKPYTETTTLWVPPSSIILNEESAKKSDTFDPYSNNFELIQIRKLDEFKSLVNKFDKTEIVVRNVGYLDIRYFGRVGNEIVLWYNVQLKSNGSMLEIHSYSLDDKGSLKMDWGRSNMTTRALMTCFLLIVYVCVMYAMGVIIYFTIHGIFKGAIYRLLPSRFEYSKSS